MYFVFQNKPCLIWNCKFSLTKYLIYQKIHNLMGFKCQAFIGKLEKPTEASIDWLNHSFNSTDQ